MTISAHGEANGDIVQLDLSTPPTWAAESKCGRSSAGSKTSLPCFLSHVGKRLEFSVMVGFEMISFSSPLLISHPNNLTTGHDVREVSYSHS